MNNMHFHCHSLRKHVYVQVAFGTLTLKTFTALVKSTVFNDSNSQ